MTERRISHVVGKGSLTHNNRVFTAKNIDPSRTPQNVEIVRIPLKEAYRRLFDEAVERYNRKQSRKCRRIQTDYYTHLFNHKICDYVLTANDKQKSFYEDLVQVGDMHNTGCGTPDAEIAKQCLTEYMEHYLKNNPNFFVFNAVIHMDEATPHLHIDYIPVAHYDKGLDTRNAMARALEEMGYKGKDAAAKWREHEREVFTKICEAHGFTIAAPQESRGHNFTCAEYREIQEEKKRLNAELQPLREMSLSAESTEMVGKKIPFSNRISIDAAEMELLQTEKKAAAVQKAESLHIQSVNDERSHRLDEREVKITKAEEHITEMTAALERKNAEIEADRKEAEYHLKRAAENDKRAEYLYNKQTDINNALNNAEKKILDKDKQIGELYSDIHDISEALGISRSSNKERIIDRCRNLISERNEYYEIAKAESIEEHKSWRFTITPAYLKERLNGYKQRALSAEHELEKNRSVIEDLRAKLKQTTDTLVNAVRAIGMLTCDNSYSRDIPERCRALIEGIRKYVFDHFKRNSDDDSCSEMCKPCIDSEIKKNVETTIHRESRSTRNGYER